MLEICQLQQLLSVAEYGTLSAAAEAIHLSQPSLSRSMKKIEEDLRVTLFDRQKNKITLNENGQLAVECARKVLDQLQQMESQVRSFDRSRRTILVGSCAPAPMWELAQAVSGLYPEMAVSSEMKDAQTLLEGLRQGIYQFIILPFAQEAEDLYCFPFEKEQLYFSLPPAHPMASSKGLYFKDLDGESVLLFSRIGFWRDVCREKMPMTRALVQHEQEDFQELVQASALPCFVSNLTMRWDGRPENRIVIPILDPEGTALYHFICRKEERKRWAALIRRIRAADGTEPD